MTGKKPYYFVLICCQLDNTVVEFMPLNIGWRKKYTCDGNKVRLNYAGYVWKIFGFLIPLPLAFILGKVYLEKEALSDDAFKMNMQIIHPLFGQYLYAGEFKILD
jgi:hypothetical protein